MLRDIDLTVDTGEVVVVIGPSGSGKSTLCRAINRLEPIDSGTITLDGQPLPEEGKALARLRADVGMVFQSFNLFAHKTVLQNVTLGPTRVKRGQSRSEAEQRGHDPARPGRHRRPGATSCPHSSPAASSSVSRSRGRWRWSPKVMLFDEPTSALDPEMINEVLDVMTALAREGMTMIVVTHEMGFARKAANRVVFMDEGEIVEQAVPDEFFTDAKSERAQDFLSKILPH